MKKYGHIIAVLFVGCIMMSCSDENRGIPIDDEEIFSFTVSFSGETAIETKAEAIQAGMIENMYVVVFDENGIFLTREKAVPTPNPGNYTIRLNPTDKEPAGRRKRTLHFVCNYDWSGFSDVKNVGKHENEVIGTLSVSDGIVYWQRIEVAEIKAGALPSIIALLRNVARISVVNNTQSPAVQNSLFAIGNYCGRGTVAPFNTSTLVFEEGSVVEAPDGMLKEVVESDFVPTGYNSVTGASVICYEKINVDSDAPLFVIVKARFEDDVTDTYYKIDIIGKGEDVLHNIQRNHHYILLITKVMDSGHPTLQEAVIKPASNNILYSVILEKYTSISDGVAALHVDKTEYTFSKGGYLFSIPFSFVPDINAAVENNGAVRFTLQQDPLHPVVDENSVHIVTTAGNAYYQAAIVPNLPDYDVYNAKLVVSAPRAQGGELQRVISFRLRPALVFGGVSVSPSAIPSAIDQPVELYFTIPSNVRSSLFPMEIFITTRQLTPNLEPGKDNGLSFDYQIPGKYRYRYLAAAPGKHVINFKTTSPATNEVLELEAELFTLATIRLKN